MGHTSFFLLYGGGREDMEFKEDKEREGIYCQSGTDVAHHKRNHLH